MIKTIPGTGTFNPQKLTPPDKDVERGIRWALNRELEKEMLELRDAVCGFKVLDMKANPTGRRILVRALVLGRVRSLSVSPFEGERRDPRTLESVFDEVLTCLSNRNLAGSKTRLLKRPITDLVRGVVNPKLGDGKWASNWCVLEVLRSEVLGKIVRIDTTGVGVLHREVVQFVAAGRHLENFASHQRKKAVESFRQMACHAFKHGATIEDLESALKEEMVRATMEA